MKTPQRCQFPYHPACAAILILLSLVSVGCEEQLGEANQYLLNAVGGSNPDSFAAKLAAEQAQCPRKLNEHTTLQSVSLMSLEKVKYHYLVTESGRPEMGIGEAGPRKTIMKQARSSHLGPVIVHMGLDVDHQFQDADGKCLLYLEMTKQDYEHLEFEEPQAVASASQPDTSPNDEADRNEMLAILKSEQAKCPRKIDEYTTLTEIEHKGINRIKYHYVVSDAGLPVLFEDTEAEVHADVAEWMKSSPLAPSITKLDMGHEHFYKTTEGKCALWLHMTKKDIQPSQGAESQPEAIAKAESTATVERKASLESESIVKTPKKGQAEPEPSYTPVAKEEPWMPEQIKQQVLRSSDNPAGVQRNPYFD
jgi:hypothetical protein